MTVVLSMGRRFDREPASSILPLLTSPLGLLKHNEVGRGTEMSYGLEGVHLPMTDSPSDSDQLGTILRGSDSFVLFVNLLERQRAIEL